MSKDANAKGAAMKVAIEERIAANKVAYDKEFGQLVMSADDRAKLAKPKPAKKSA